MLGKLGADGEIEATDSLVENIMSVLADIDGGQYDPKLPEVKL